MDCLFDVMQQIIFTLDMADVLIVHRRMLRGFGGFGGTAREFAKRLSIGAAQLCPIPVDSLGSVFNYFCTKGLNALLLLMRFRATLRIFKQEKTRRKPCTDRTLPPNRRHSRPPLSCQQCRVCRLKILQSCNTMAILVLIVFLRFVRADRLSQIFVEQTFQTHILF